MMRDPRGGGETMDINVREERGITVLELSGELTGRSGPTPRSASSSGRGRTAR